MSKFMFFRATYRNSDTNPYDTTESINRSLSDKNIEDVQMSTVQTSYGYVVNFVLKIKEDEV